MSRPTVMWPKELVKMEYIAKADISPRITSVRAKKEAKQRNAQAAARKAHPNIKPCEKCGNTLAQRHHDDYDDPLNVRWLCRACHDAFHESQSEASYKRRKTRTSADAA